MANIPSLTSQVRGEPLSPAMAGTSIKHVLSSVNKTCWPCTPGTSQHAHHSSILCCKSPWLPKLSRQLNTIAFKGLLQMQVLTPRLHGGVESLPASQAENLLSSHSLQSPRRALSFGRKHFETLDLLGPPRH